MDLAFTFTYLILRCLSIEEDICALSISMRQAALGTLGLPVAAFVGVKDSKSRIASAAAKKVIGHRRSFKFVAISDDGKSQDFPEKVIHM